MCNNNVMCNLLTLMSVHTCMQNSEIYIFDLINFINPKGINK